jgi:eukaryotic-like serine/threonine-protein kinase
MILEMDSLLQDRYRIIKELAQSGMGTIYLASDEVLNVDVAIKENLYTTAAHSTQFHQEVTILAGLRHPSLPRVIDHFVIEDVGEYLVMDYVEGRDLKEFLETRGGTLSENEVVRIGVVICDALEYMHSRTPPIIHRDIKPANIKVTEDGQVVLVDFGLAKHYEQGEMTAVGAKGVTPGYSPVEQYGQGTDARSDIYALGAALYTLLTGDVPPEALDRAMGNEELPRMDEITPEISSPLRTVVQKAMAIKAESRYQSAGELKAALLEAIPLPEFSPKKPVLPISKVPSSPPSKLEAADPTIRVPEKEKRRVWLWTIPVLILVGAGVLFGIRLLGGWNPFSGGEVISPSETPFDEMVSLNITETETQNPATQTPEGTAAAALPSITPTPSPEGTPQGGGSGQIAFVSERSGLPQIFLMNFESSEVEQLTFEAEGACQPAWSPNGMKLAYISPCSGRKERYEGASIFIISLDTHRSDLISTLGTGDYDPAWSPDGSRLAFTSLQTGKPQIFIYEFGAGTSHLLMNRSIVNQMPAWSPDGGQIIYVSPSPVTNRPVLFVVDADGVRDPKGVLGQNYQKALRPDWSPEGNLILFDLGGESQIGGRLIDINQDVPINTALGDVESPAISPDAEWLVCDGVMDLPGRDIFIMLRTGARLTRLTEDPADDYQAAWQP